MLLCVVDQDRLFPVLLCGCILGKLTVGGILPSFGKELLACGRAEILLMRFPAGWLSALGSRASQLLDMSPSLGGCSIAIRGGLVTSFCWGQECNQARGTLWIFDPRPTWMYEYRAGEIKRLAPALQCSGGLLGAGGEHSEGHVWARAPLLQLLASLWQPVLLPGGDAGSRGQAGGYLCLPGTGETVLIIS